MYYDLLHPRDQLVEIIHRIYRGGMTTLSGGNLSILDDEGNIWITPAGIDKGKLKSEDIIQVGEDGRIEGRHRPSSEYPFHCAIYKKRPDLHAIVHAHPPGLIAYSIANRVPETRVIPQAFFVCGPIGFSPYAMTGSEELGENIAATLGEGFNVAILENHGVVCGGETLLRAFQRMETLEFTARMLISAHQIGYFRTLSDQQLDKFNLGPNPQDEFKPSSHSVVERQLRKEIIEIVMRACDRKLMCSTEGVVSARVDSESFLITPTDVDRFRMRIEDLVLIKNGSREKGKIPSRATRLHRMIYQADPKIASIISSQPPHAMAFAITSERFDSHTIPESYIMLRETPNIDHDILYDRPDEIAKAVSPAAPVLLIENDCVMTTGSNLLKAYDRLEVLEYSARSLLAMPFLGGLKPIDDERIKEIDKKFFNK
jgi:L-fuculose-phosphate aldolase